MTWGGATNFHSKGIIMCSGGNPTAELRPMSQTGGLKESWGWKLRARLNIQKQIKESGQNLCTWSCQVEPLRSWTVGQRCPEIWRRGMDWSWVWPQCTPPGGTAHTGLSAGLQRGGLFTEAKWDTLPGVGMALPWGWISYNSRFWTFPGF